MEEESSTLGFRTTCGRRRVVIPEVQSAPWYAVRVRPNYEKPVAAALHGKGFQEFLPLIRSKRQWSDRVKIMDLPLFPGYLFCRLNLEERLPLLTTPGFLYLVGVGKNPEPVDEAEIAGIQAVLRSGLTVTPWPNLVVGQKVRLKHGPLRGLEGVLNQDRKPSSNLCIGDAFEAVHLGGSRSRVGPASERGQRIASGLSVCRSTATRISQEQGTI